ncbi:MAG: hypothetical protein AAFY11_12540 [Cyanobacteria bacterium J06641_5]
MIFHKADSQADKAQNPELPTFIEAVSEIPGQTSCMSTPPKCRANGSSTRWLQAASSNASDTQKFATILLEFAQN